MDVPFTPQANTFAIAVTSTASTPVQLLGTGNGSNRYRVVNVGPNTAFIAFGNSAVVAVAPVAGTPANGVPSLSGTVETFGAAPNTYVSLICAATQTAIVYFTPGDGI